MNKRILPTARSALASFNRERTIEDFARRKKRTIYGGRAVVANIGGLARNTRDYDIASPNPRKDSSQLARVLNKQAGFPEYYNEQSKVTKGVWKTRDIGPDLRKNTPDDYTVVDFSKRKLPYVIMDRTRYSTLGSTIADKRLALSDQQFAFRHAKDREDLNRIRAYQRLRRLRSQSGF